MNLFGLFRRQNTPAEPRLVGHPALGGGESFQHGDTLYLSIDEAIYRQRRGYEVTIRFEPTPEDEAALASFRAASLEKLARLREDSLLAHRITQRQELPGETQS